MTLKEFTRLVLEGFKERAQLFVNQGYDFNTVHSYIEQFKALKARNKLPADKIDIDAYDTFEQLKEVVDQYKEVKSKREIEKEIKVAGAELVHEDNKYRIYWIKTKEAAIQLGTGTKWCISAKNNQFNEYARQANIYFLISKTETIQTSPSLYKLALLYYTKSFVELFNAQDIPLSLGTLIKSYLKFLTPFQNEPEFNTPPKQIFRIAFIKDIPDPRHRKLLYDFSVEISDTYELSSNEVPVYFDPEPFIEMREQNMMEEYNEGTPEFEAEIAPYMSLRAYLKHHKIDLIMSDDV